MKNRLILFMTILFIGFGLFASCNKKEVTTEENVYYTCPMHSQVHEHKPGKCPICGMDLVKKEDKH